jgi:hypothetical protein
LAKEYVNRSKTRQQKISTQTQYAENNKRVERTVRKDNRNWINEQLKLAEEAERRGDINQLYTITRKLSQIKFAINRPIKTKSGTIMTTHEEQMNRWEDTFL